MKLENVTMDTIQKLESGVVKEAVELELRRAALDCKDRPGVRTPRKISIDIFLAPKMGQTGACDEVESKVVIGSSTPKRSTMIHSFGLKANGTMLFNPDSPGNINQTTLLGDDDDDDDM